MTCGLNSSAPYNMGSRNTDTVVAFSVSVLVYLVFAGISLWRLIKQSRPRFSAGKCKMNHRIFFHLFVFSATICRIPHVTWMMTLPIAIPESCFNASLLDIQYSISTYTYSCTMISYCLEFAAVSLVIVQWASTTSKDAETSYTLTRVAIGVNVAFTFATVFCLGRMSALKHDLFVGGCQGCQSDKLYVVWMVMSTSLFVLTTAGILAYGLCMLRQLVQHPQWKSLKGSVKRKAMFRMHVVMLVCSLSYLMKLALIAWLLVADLSGKNLSNTVPMVVWVLCEKVLPFILPMSCLLHMMRKRLSGTEHESLRLTVRRTLFLTDVGPVEHNPSDDYDSGRFPDGTGYQPAPP